MFSVTTKKPVTSEDTSLPPWAIAFIVVLGVFVVVAIIVVVVVVCLKKRKEKRQGEPY